MANPKRNKDAAAPSPDGSTSSTSLSPYERAIADRLTPEARRNASTPSHDLQGCTVDILARVSGPDGNRYTVARAASDRDAGQYLLREADGTVEVVHVDTVLFPLPLTGTSVPDEVQEILSQKLATQFAQARGLEPTEEDLLQHAEALRSGTADLPILRHSRERGFLDWVGGLFGSKNPDPGGSPVPVGTEAELNQRLLQVSRAQVNVLSSKQGPDGGNLACVWAVDRIFTLAFGRRLTRALSTAVINKELNGGIGRRVRAEQAQPGHIIISPTGTGKGHGHIGILGEDGKIYSNSSKRARWEQNHTVDSWRKLYKTDKGMDVHYYQLLPTAAGLRTLPHPSGADAFVTPATASPPPGSEGDLELFPSSPSLPAYAAQPPTSADAQALLSIDQYWHTQDQRRRHHERNRSSAFRLLAEGDSWFDFKIQDDVIDWLEQDYGYDITNVAKAGACLYEMAYGPDDTGFLHRDPTQLEELVRHIKEKRPHAILLSGAGNDFVGPEFIMLIHHSLASPTGINEQVLKGLFEQEIEPAYRRIIATANAAAKREFNQTLPIFVHGYDYVFPDGRSAFNVIVKKIGPWMDPSFEMKGYPNRNGQDLARRRDLVRRMIDAVYEMHQRIARDFSNVHVVDVRNLLTDRTGEWHDELHPNSKGFRKVAAKFHESLTQVLGNTPRSHSGPTAPAGRSLDLSAELAGTPPVAAASPALFSPAPPTPRQPLPQQPAAAVFQESSAVLFARARQALTMENLLPWVEASPLTAIDIYDRWLEEAADDTTGALTGAPESLRTALVSASPVPHLLQDALRWHPASAYADHLQRELSSTSASTFTLENLRDEYDALFQTCQIQPQHKSTIAWYLNRIKKGQATYEALAKELNKIPWEFIAITHSLEASNDFSKHLHNGDPLTARTVREPDGHPKQGQPPFTFTESALDAMRIKNYHLQTNWSDAAMLFRWENYNGWGYRNKGIHTPYLWSFSNHYQKGKFVADGKYDANAVSKQAGAAVLLRALRDS